MLISNPSSFWKFTNDLSRRDNTPSFVCYNNNWTDSPIYGANLFSKYFFYTLMTPHPLLLIFLILNDIANNYDLPSNCAFTIKDVQSSSNSLKNMFSNRPDGIATCLLFNCHYSLVVSINYLFSRSLDEANFPSVWKIRSITPILKSDDISLVHNYRPISIIPDLDKLFESIVYLFIKRNHNHILVIDQHGFRLEKFNTTSTLSFTTYILESFEDKSQVDTVVSDFTKAFDTIDHKCLDILVTS